MRFGPSAFGDLDDQSTKTFGIKNKLEEGKEFRMAREIDFCDHRQKLGYASDQCFKTFGYSYWYDEPQENAKVVFGWGKMIFSENNFLMFRYLAR